jgi:hypothetical protein
MCEREGGRGVGSMGKGGTGGRGVGGRGVVVSCGHCTSSLIRIKRREGGGGVSSWGLLFISVHKSLAYRLPHNKDKKIFSDCREE